MNALGLLLVWMAIQVTLFCLSGIGLYVLVRRGNPAAGAWAAGATMLTVIVISALSFSPWPHVWTIDGPVGRRGHDFGG